MSNVKLASTGWFHLFFERQILALPGIAFGMLVLAGQISILPFLLFIAPYLLAFPIQTRALLLLTARQVNILSWFYLPLFMLDIFLWSRSFIPATLHLILAMLLLKIYQEKANRDYHQIILLSFLLVLAASSLTINFSFLIGFLVFLLCCLAALISFEIKRAASLISSSQEKGQSPAEIFSGSSTIQRQPRQRRQVIKSIFFLSARALAAISLGGTFFFFGLPRLGGGYFSRVQNRYSTLSGFTDRIQLGGIGKIQLDSTVVMRVQFSRPLKGFEPLKWRGITLDYFDGRNWSKQAGGRQRFFPLSQNFHLQDPAGPGEWLHYQVLMEPAGTAYLFTLDQILNLEGRLYPLSFDPQDDSIHARVHPSQRLTYQAESYLRLNRNPAPASNDPTALNLKPYLQLPNLDPRIPAVARQIIGSTLSSRQKAEQVEKYLRMNYSYSLDQSAINSPQPLESFLFKTKSGHCEYFATAMVVFLRVQQVPCRIVNGFQGGEYNEVGDDYIIRGSQAHSWVEVFIPGQGWTPYDPTPASNAELERNYLTKVFANYWDALELFWGQWVLPYDDMLQASLFSDLQHLSLRWTGGSRKMLQSQGKNFEQMIKNLYQRIETWFVRYRGVLPWTVPGILLGAWLLNASIPAIRRRWLRARQSRRPASSQATQLYLEMLRLLRKKGVKKSANQTPLEFALSIADDRLVEKVLFLTRQYNQVRFGKAPFGSAENDEAWELLQSLRAK